MEISSDEVINALLDENKRLTLENIVLRATVRKYEMAEGYSEESEEK